MYMGHLRPMYTAVYTAVFTDTVIYTGREHGRIYARVHGSFRIVVTGEDTAGALYKMTNNSHTICIDVANHVML